MDVRLLLALKFKLVVRSLSGRQRRTTAFAIAALVALLAPAWIGITRAAYHATLTDGAPAVVSTFGLLHMGWLAASILLGSFAEGFDLRAVLRYPVRPHAVMAINVLVAPLDLTGFFLLPPLVGVTAAAARASVFAGVGVALMALLVLLTTAAGAQLLLACLARWLRREWTRAVAGVLLSLVFLLPGYLMRHTVSRVAAGDPRGMHAFTHDLSALAPVLRALRFVPTLALPSWAVRAAYDGRPLAFVMALVGATAVLAGLIALATRAALTDARQGADAGSEAASTAGEGLTGAISAWAERWLPTDLVTLVARELRTVARTPQTLIGLIATPMLVLILPRAVPRPYDVLALTFACLLPPLNLSANQFGLDHAGVRAYFLLPIPPARLLVAKNLTALVLVAVTATLAFAVVVISGRIRDGFTLACAALGLGIALPPLLSTGNFLSVAHPWRLTFKMGGAPPGAMSSAFIQFGVLAIVAVLFGLPLVVLPALGPDTRGPELAVLAVMMGLSAVLWRALLPWAARRLVARREDLVDRLARPQETG